MASGGKVFFRIGIGGWTYKPWRGTFYPAGLSQKRELEYAASQLTSIEINGTFYGAQKPESFMKWHEETPADFVFSVKAPRFATNRKVLSEASESIERFFTGGIMELKHKLGPVNWQFPPTKKFDPVDFEGFLKLLPRQVESQRIRHVVEVRHESFKTTEFIDMAREYGIAIALAGDSKYVQIADITADFIYARIMGTCESSPDGYSEAELDRWAERAKSLAKGVTPKGLETIAPQQEVRPVKEVYLYVISGYKQLNPAAAKALIERIG
jgi:uncharacterized protein YecE (DUF72 family)